jgi:hypothetical protein
MAYPPIPCGSAMRWRACVGALGAFLALASSAHEVQADPELAPAASPAPAPVANVAKAAPARPTFHLEYRLLDGVSQEHCPPEAVARSLLNRFFRYEVIDDHAGPGLAIDIASSRKPAHFEGLAHVLREDKLPIVTSRQYEFSIADYACYRVVYDAAVTLWVSAPSTLDELKAPPKVDPEPVTLTPVVRHALPDAPPAPAPPPTPSITVTLPSAAPAWKRPQGFMLTAGLTASVGLTPTPSFGGLAGLNYRRGAWSGGLEGRVEHGLVPGYLEAAPIDSLYAGAALVAPCVHEGVFSGCFVTEAGGYSFSLPTQERPIGGRFAMMALGMRANFEHRVAEHFLLRGFVQFSAIPVSPSVDLEGRLSDRTQHLWNTGPGFGTIGLTLISVP